MDYMKTFKDLCESLTPKSVTIAVSRCNPFSTAHLQLVEQLNTHSRLTESLPVFFINKTNDNILTEDFKSSWSRAASPDTAFISVDEGYIEFTKDVSKKYSILNIIISSNNFTELSEKIHSQLDNLFTEVNVIEFSGESLDEAESRIKELAKNNDYDNFKQEFPEGTDTQSLFDKLKPAEIVESTPEREEFFKGQYQVGDFVVSHDDLLEVLYVGANYITVINEQNELYKVWPKDVKLTESRFTPKYFKIHEELFNETLKDFNDGKFTDKLALITAHKKLEEYIKDNDVEKFNKFKILIENINQTERFKTMITEEEMKLITPAEKLEAAKLIANSFKVTEGSTPEELINNTIEKYNKKDKTEEVSASFHRMLAIATSLGINFNLDLLKEDLTEATHTVSYIDREYQTKTKSFKDREGDAPDNGLNRAKDHIKKLESEHEKSQYGTIRGKIKLVSENTSIPTADYKLSKDGKKYPAHRIVIKNDERDKVQESLENKEPMNHLDPQPNYSDHEQIDTLALDHSEESDKDLENISDAELDTLIITHLTDDDYLDTYDMTDLDVIDEETGEVYSASPEESQLNEVLSRMERLKSRIRFHRTESKRARKMKIALNKKSDQKTLVKRARRLAVKALELRLARKPLNTLSISEKERIEARIAKAKPILNRLTIRLLPKIRKLESDRLHEGIEV